MVYECITPMSPAEIFANAKRFFAERVPQTAAFPEREGPGFLLLRGQGGEEIVFAAHADDQGTHVRASTLLFDQPLNRFLSTLPPSAAAIA